jgi:hypothetical protein
LANSRTQTARHAVLGDKGLKKAVKDGIQSLIKVVSAFGKLLSNRKHFFYANSPSCVTVLGQGSISLSDSVASTPI